MTWLPGVDGIEVEVAIMVCKGLGGETPQGPERYFLLLFSFFVPKPTARVLYF